MLSAFSVFFFNDTATTEIYTLSLHDALPISEEGRVVAEVERHPAAAPGARSGAHPDQLAGRTEAVEPGGVVARSEEHTSGLPSPCNLVCRLLLGKKKNNTLMTSRVLAPFERC